MTQVIPNPPRLTGNPKNDPQILQDYLTSLFDALVLSGKVLERLDKIAALGSLDTSISNPPTQAEVQAIKNKMNAIIAAATI